MRILYHTIYSFPFTCHLILFPTNLVSRYFISLLFLFALRNVYVSWWFYFRSLLILVIILIFLFLGAILLIRVVCCRCLFVKVTLLVFRDRIMFLILYFKIVLDFILIKLFFLRVFLYFINIFNLFDQNCFIFQDFVIKLFLVLLAFWGKIE